MHNPVAFDKRRHLAAVVQAKAPLDDSVIVGALRSGWGLDVDAVTYAPVGGGSWHWHTTCEEHGRLFVTVDAVASRSAASELEWAYQVPLALVRSGRAIARPPIVTTEGRVFRELDERWVVSIWPVIEGRSTQDGTYASAEDAMAVLAIVAKLHGVPIRILGETPPRFETFVLPDTQRLLQLVDERWPAPHVGPLAAAAEELLHRHAEDIHRLATLYDELVPRAAAPDTWVLTHGEPHAANVVFTDAGPVLIDWDTAKIAPRERDLWMIASDGFDVGPADADLLRLYRAQWDLGELADYARRFANPADQGPEGDAAWEDFTSYVVRAAHI